ncbi:hypothetical protein VP01_4176g1 [Puccinia sorghi]|uniref:Uncharacterized protein n=1 Tax=Puccinia sorghi TaxID=27349 RepID=A0A0L6UQW5_9BASI|nr:hypothetical protein VP01_4176g1 [Puccinia sorghi]
MEMGSRYVKQPPWNFLTFLPGEYEHMKEIPAEFLFFTGIKFAQSLCGLPSQRLIIWQNPKNISILPATVLHETLVILVRADTYNAKKYKTSSLTTWPPAA